MVNLMDVSFNISFVMYFSFPSNYCSNDIAPLQCVCITVKNISSLTLVQDSGNGKLGIGEFATLWKKVQNYLVSYAYVKPQIDSYSS